MITRPQLRLRLRAIANADWAIAENSVVTRELRSRPQGGFDVSEARSQQFTVTLHRDLPLGRGSAQASFGCEAINSDAAIDRVAQACNEQIRPPWRMLPPSAAAQVRLADPALREPTRIDAAARALDTALRALTGAELQWSLRTEAHQDVVETSTDNAIKWASTRIAVAVRARIGAHWLGVTRLARQLSELQLATLADELQTEITALAHASATPRGTMAIVLDQTAMLFDGDLGIWQALADHASVHRLARGITRLNNVRASALRISSDGARNFGWHSAPVEADGAAVRHFAIYSNGTVGTRSSNLADAAAANLVGNGAIRNIEASDTGPTWQPPTEWLEIHRFTRPQFDNTTGVLTAAIGRATLHQVAKTTTVAGGAVRLDLVQLLHAGRLIGDAVQTAAYRGAGQLFVGTAPIY